MALFAHDCETAVESLNLANGKGGIDGEGNEVAIVNSDGDGKGDVNGVGKREAEGQTEGEGSGEKSGDGEGSGSPTRLTVRGASGLRCERNVEGTGGCATGTRDGRVLTSSRFGRIPSGAPAIGVGLFS